MHSTAATSDISVSHRIRVRYAETDQMGVVYHANYIVWFHEARDALLREAGVHLEAIEREGYRFPVIDASCRYLRSARYGDEVIVHACLKHENVARMCFHYEVSHARTLRLLAVGKTVSVMTDVRGRLLVRMPESLDRLIMALAERQRIKNELES